MSIGAEIGAAAASSAMGSVMPIVGMVRDRKWRDEDIARADRLTAEQWRREDSAVQRRVADLKASGINPLLAAGSAASSSQPLYSSRAPNSEVPEIDILANMMARENIASSKAQRQLILAETEKIKDSNARDQGIYDHNMSIKGNNPYGATPTAWGSLIGILRDYYNGKYKGGAGEQAIEKFAEDVANTGIGKAQTEQVIRDVENADRANKAADAFQKGQRNFWSWLRSGFEGASPEANHY